MDREPERPEPLVYPEPVFTPSLLDGAAFLYFQDPLVLTLAPAPTLAGGGFEMLDWIQERRPDWGLPFLALDELWGLESDGCVATLTLLDPLRDHFKSSLIVVPGDAEALTRAGELISAAGFDRDQMRTVADPVVAAGELMNHLYLEMWLELGEDTEALYAYTAELFSDEDRLEETLHRAYLLRIAHLPASAPFEPLLLNSPRLAPFLLGLPGGEDAEEADVSFKLGQAAWELFRQVLKPYLEPLTRDAVETIAICRHDRMDEVDALRLQMERLAERIAVPEQPEQLIADVEQFIRLHVADDIAELLRLNSDAKQQFLDSLFTDRATWAAGLAMAQGGASGSAEWTMGGAIATIATLASKGYGTLAERRKQLSRNDYRLIYSVTRQ